MKPTILLLLLTSCAHVKSFWEQNEECQRVPAHYDQCMVAQAEEAREAAEAARQRSLAIQMAAAASLKGFSEGIRDNRPVASSINCTTSYIGNQAYTTCN